MRVSDYITNFLKEKEINDVFMLTGYGAMYLNDAIKLSGINYYTTRNEATAPIMAESYARVKNKVGIACVTAGPGSTNALPGLAEAFVDSAPIIVISGQVDYKHTTHSTKLKNIRTFGTAEINIIPIVKPLTKFAEILKNPNDVRYIMEKAFFLSTNGKFISFSKAKVFCFFFPDITIVIFIPLIRSTLSKFISGNIMCSLIPKL